jgi:hypothetical protein
MRFGRRYLTRDNEVSGIPHCTNCGQAMRHFPNENYGDRSSFTAEVRGWWVCDDCLTCWSCNRTLRKDEECDCWLCPCCENVPGAWTSFRHSINRKGQTCSVCGCREGACTCKFACVACGHRHSVPVCQVVANGAARAGISVEAYIEECMKALADRAREAGQGQPIPGP